MATPAPDDLPFDLTGCRVTAVEWPARGLRLILGGKTAAGRDVDSVRLTFEEVVNHRQLHGFLTARLTYNRRRVRIPFVGVRWIDEYHYGDRPLRLPARLTHLRRSRAARASYPDRVFAAYHGAPPAAGRGQRLYLLALSEARFRGRPFPVVCGRVTLVAAGGTALGGAETPRPRPLPAAVLVRLGRRFAEAVLAGDRAAVDRLLTPGARRRLGRRGLRAFLPRGWAGTVRHCGGPKQAAKLTLEYLSVEADPGAEVDDGPSFARMAPDVPPHTVRGVVQVYPGPPDSDVDPMAILYVVGDNRAPRIGHAEPN
jgi:hypothetical protein